MKEEKESAFKRGFNIQNSIKDTAIDGDILDILQDILNLTSGYTIQEQHSYKIGLLLAQIIERNTQPELNSRLNLLKTHLNEVL